MKRISKSLYSVFIHISQASQLFCNLFNYDTNQAPTLLTCHVGVYVEEMVDSSAEKLYAGLLTVGDEILEVNGENVDVLGMDEVTDLLTKSTSATVRVLRHGCTDIKTHPR